MNYELRLTRCLKSNVINIVFGLFLLSVLVSCVKNDTTRYLIGTWQSDSGKISVAADGTFESTFSQPVTNGATWNYQGIWRIEKSLLVMVVTNASAINTTNFQHVDSVDRYTIIKVDKTSLTMEYDRQPGAVISYKRK